MQNRAISEAVFGTTIKLSKNAIRVLLAIDKQITAKNKNDGCWIDYGSIEDEYEICNQTVKNAVKELVAQGLISKNGKGIIINEELIVQINIEIA